ncbi:hypothetical protein ACP70R_000015 [Stipagrostis hirtigluma subsp. patula]
MAAEGPKSLPKHDLPDLGSAAEEPKSPYRHGSPDLASDDEDKNKAAAGELEKELAEVEPDSDWAKEEEPESGPDVDPELIDGDGSSSSDDDEDRDSESSDDGGVSESDDGCAPQKKRRR